MAATTDRDVVWFEDLRLADRASAGGKCASLGELLVAGAAVPQGFCITAGAWRRTLAHDGLSRRVREATRAAGVDDRVVMQAAHDAVGRTLRRAALPPGLESEVRAAYTELCRRTGRDDVPVAVRSSSIAEDGTRASFAGQQETYLWIRGADAVLDRVRRCWAGLFTPRAVSYRAALDPAGRQESLQMAVGVQEMADAEVAGVVFTVSPTTGDPSVMAVNASWGLGEAVVSGEVTPDEFWLSKVGLGVTRRTITHKARRSVPAGTGTGTETVEVPAALVDVACLDDELLRELGELAIRVERHYGAPQDIEWALVRDDVGGHRFLMLQSRPETVVGRRAVAADPAPGGRADSYLSVVQRLSHYGRRPG